MRNLAAFHWLLAIGVSVCLATVAQAEVFTIIAVPDTEYYTESYPAVFLAQTQWIADHAKEHRIAFVTHLGDAVHHPIATPVQWDIVTGAMDKLDGVVPYGVCAGNHDLEDAAGFGRRFGPSRFSRAKWYKGSSPDKIDQCQVFPAAGYDMLHLSLRTNPDAAARKWALDQIQANSGKPTIISTHDYLDLKGRTKAGADIWNDLVKDNPQVFLVLGGHTRGVYRQVSANSSKGKVLEILSDYQDHTTKGGQKDTGYLREIFFDTIKGKISVKTFSPTYAAQPRLTKDGDQFSYDAQFLPPTSGKSRLIFVTGAAAADKPAAARD